MGINHSSEDNKPMIKLSDELYIPPMGEIIRDRNAKAMSKKRVTRQFAGSRSTRFDADWNTAPTTANFELYTSLKGLRARSREAERDNAHFKKYLSLCRSNIIGHKGIQLQVRSRKMDGSLNVDLNKMVEGAWWKWGQRETCTVSGKLDWLGVQRLCVNQLARDGEFLIRKIPTDNEFGLSLQVVNVDYLDEFLTSKLQNGNRIIMSIEVDQFDKPVAYWLTTPYYDANFTTDSERRLVRVPADEMIHGFLTLTDESQTRGIPWGHASLLNAKHYKDYIEGTILDARMGVYNLGFIEQDVADEDAPFTGAEDDTGISVPPQIDSTPLSFNRLLPGEKLTQFKTDSPNQNHPAFAKTILTGEAAGYDVNYFELSGDMEAINFSSARVGLEESRNNWRALQDFVSTALCREVYHSWARSALLARALKITAKEFNEIQNPSWRPRGWSYIEPLKDINATVTSLENKTTTWTATLGDKGMDFIDFIDEWVAEQEYAKSKGVDLTPVSVVRVTDTGTAPKDESGPPATSASASPKRGYSNGHDEGELSN